MRLWRSNWEAQCMFPSYELWAPSLHPLRITRGWPKSEICGLGLGHQERGFLGHQERGFLGHQEKVYLRHLSQHSLSMIFTTVQTAAPLDLWPRCLFPLCARAHLSLMSVTTAVLEEIEVSCTFRHSLAGHLESAQNQYHLYHSPQKQPPWRLFLQFFREAAVRFHGHFQHILFQRIIQHHPKQLRRHRYMYIVYTWYMYIIYTCANNIHSPRTWNPLYQMSRTIGAIRTAGLSPTTSHSQ